MPRSRSTRLTINAKAMPLHASPTSPRSTRPDDSRVDLPDDDDSTYVTKSRYSVAHFPKNPTIGAPLEEWRLEARCSGLPPESIDAFFFNEGPMLNTTKRFCEGCPVKAECLAYALGNDMEGVWGGTSHAQRIAIQAAA